MRLMDIFINMSIRLNYLKIHLYLKIDFLDQKLTKISKNKYFQDLIINLKSLKKSPNEILLLINIPLNLIIIYLPL